MNTTDDERFSALRERLSRQMKIAELGDLHLPGEALAQSAEAFVVSGVHGVLFLRKT